MSYFNDAFKNWIQEERDKILAEEKETKSTKKRLKN